MKTVEEIIAYLEEELADAYKVHNETKRGKDKSRAYSALVKIVMLEQILEDIK